MDIPLPVDRMTDVCENLASHMVAKSICKYYRFNLFRLSEGCEVASETRKVTNRFDSYRQNLPNWTCSGNLWKSVSLDVGLCLVVQWYLWHDTLLQDTKQRKNSSTISYDRSQEVIMMKNMAKFESQMVWACTIGF